MILLKVNPKVDSGTLRKLLVNIIPPGTLLHCSALRHLKTVALYHKNHPDDSNISESGATVMLANRKIKKNELATLRDSFIKYNLIKFIAT